MYRHLMGRVFNTLVRIVAVPGVNDTQCGFKAFRAEVARDIFPDLRLYDGSKVVVGPRVTGFDVEILFLARRRGYRLVEVPVEWTHVPGSKVAPLSDSIRMFADVLRVRLNAIRGRYD
jgi:dolichyl-phosphate beta-glucosyltransferase